MLSHCNDLGTPLWNIVKVVRYLDCSQKSRITWHCHFRGIPKNSSWISCAVGCTIWNRDSLLSFWASLKKYSIKAFPHLHFRSHSPVFCVLFKTLQELVHSSLKLKGGLGLDSRVRHIVDRENGGGCGAYGFLWRVGIPPELFPHLAGTCENNSPAFSHSADPVAISTLSEGEWQRGKPDRQKLALKQGFYHGGGGVALCILWVCSVRGPYKIIFSCVSCITAEAKTWNMVWTCTREGLHSEFHRCLGQKRDGKKWKE